MKKQASTTKNQNTPSSSDFLFQNGPLPVMVPPFSLSPLFLPSPLSSSCTLPSLPAFPGTSQEHSKQTLSHGDLEQRDNPSPLHQNLPGGKPGRWTNSAIRLEDGAQGGSGPGGAPPVQPGDGTELCGLSALFHTCPGGPGVKMDGLEKEEAGV